MKICLYNGYIVGYSKTTGQKVSYAEWERIQIALSRRPTPGDGFQVMLRADTLEWEQIPMPQGGEEEQDPELSDSEALDIILGGAE